eukprot:gene32991-44139_t
MSEEQAAPETVPAAQLSPSEIAKKLGNDAFLAKKYDEAIEHYSKGLLLDPENAVFYSNRSACYGALKQWERAYEDALMCVSKDPKFIKGYYRLSSAQTEMKKFDDSIATLRAALTLEPGNEVIVRQLKSVQAKKNAESSKEGVKPKRQLDEAQLKELAELQEQTNTYARDLRMVRSKIASIQRETRVNRVTNDQIRPLPEETPMYRSVGKAFIFAGKTEVESRLEKEFAEFTKTQKDLLDRQEYLD